MHIHHKLENTRRLEGIIAKKNFRSIRPTLQIIHNRTYLEVKGSRNSQYRGVHGTY